MGTPSKESWHAALYDWVGVYIQNDVREHFTSKATILDVGAGWGKYHFLLPEYRMDACEVWEPNVHKITKFYRQVFAADICDLQFDYYDAIILGDVLEHITRPRAQDLVEKLVSRCMQLYVAVPYLYKQGEAEGNPYERHEQDDLTLEIMAAEYPELRLVKEQDGRGVYICA